MSYADYAKRLPGEPANRKAALKWFLRRQDKRRPLLVRRFGKNDQGLWWKYAQVTVRTHLECIFGGVAEPKETKAQLEERALRSLRELDVYEERRLAEGPGRGAPPDFPPPPFPF